MSAVIVRRLLAFLATLLATSIVVFVVLEVLPGDPAQVMLGVDAEPDAVARLREKLGLERPTTVRYFDWLLGFATGNLGESYTYSVPVLELIVERLAVTVPLALIAMLLTTIIALAAGVFAAAHHNRPGDWGVMLFAQLGIAMPNFWFGILLVLLFAVTLGWFNAGGFPGWEDDALASFQALLLPAVSLAIVQSAILARVTRSSVLDVLREDYVRTARAKGLSKRAALWRHGLRNALIPVVTVMGLQFAFLLSGTIIIENVFYLPGLGRLIFQSISQRDLVVVKDVVMLMVAKVVIINFVIDLLYVVIDPRLRTAR
ncbi:MAG: ABC transporter permease [Alphaproteobacteria bacterium]|nr:ABC transporter permease [Alphaproteobacteria bacterium]